MFRFFILIPYRFAKNTYINRELDYDIYINRYFNIFMQVKFNRDYQKLLGKPCLAIYGKGDLQGLCMLYKVVQQ